MTDNTSVQQTIIDISKIRMDGGTQARVRISIDVVNDYADRMEDGDQFPAVRVYYDGEHNWLGDGFHRIHAALKNHYKEFACEVHQGTLRDAIFYSLTKANRNHGLRPSIEDKRAAVTTMLKDAEWSQWTDARIAADLGVSHPFVAKMRLELSGNVSGSGRRKFVRGGKEYTMNTGGITAANASRSSQPPAPPAEGPLVPPGNWYETWQEYKKRMSDVVSFATTGENDGVFLAFEGDAAKVANLLGLKMQRFAMPDDQFPVRMAIKIELMKPNAEGVSWFEVLFTLLDTKMHHYPEFDPEFVKIADSLQMNVVNEGALLEEFSAPIEIESSDNDAFPKPGLPAQPAPWPATPQEATDEQRAAALRLDSQCPVKSEIDSIEEGLELVDQHLTAILDIYQQIHALDDERAHHVGGFLLRGAQNRIVPTQLTVRKLIERPADIVHSRAEIEGATDELKLRAASTRASALKVGDDWLDRELHELFAAVAVQRAKIKAAA